MSANPKTVVVLVSSFPYAIDWIQENVPAIVHMAHNSQEEGNALADVLFGDYNPGGPAGVTWAKSLDDLPPMMDYDIRKGRTYMYFKGQPLYPFGFGLSYTTFEYSNLRDSAPSVNAAGEVSVSVDVRNTGAVAGDEVVQLYVKHVDSAVERPARELRGFERISLAARRNAHRQAAAQRQRPGLLGCRQAELRGGTRQAGDHGGSLIGRRAAGKDHRCEGKMKFAFQLSLLSVCTLEPKLAS